MKHIRNVQRAWMRLGHLIEQHAEAVRQHRPRTYLQLEMQAVRESIIDYELRQERKAALRNASRAALVFRQAEITSGINRFSDLLTEAKSRASA